jgi:ABC-type oligopeptide transport system substrate-binding subunit
MRKRRIIAALTLPVLLATSACTSSSKNGKPGKVRQGGSVTLTINGEPTTLDPQARDDGNLRDVANNIYDRLLDRSPDGAAEADQPHYLAVHPANRGEVHGRPAI